MKMKYRYDLYEKNFNQPTLLGVLSGDRVKDVFVKSTNSIKVAENWANHPMQYYVRVRIVKRSNDMKNTNM
jgi:hypothetical protein